MDSSKLTYQNYLMLKEYGNIDVAEQHISCLFFSIDDNILKSFYHTMQNITDLCKGDRYTTRFTYKLFNYLYFL